MTMTTSMENLSPEGSLGGLNSELMCEVCGETRENHGDKKHKFSTDGQLLEIEQGPPPKQQPPLARDPREGPNVYMAFTTLVEVLAERQLLNSADIIRIFRGEG